MRRGSALIIVVLLALALLLPTVVSAAYPPVTFYVTATNPPANTTIWCADWRQVSIGPLAFGQIAKVKAPSSGDSSWPGSGRFIIAGFAGYGTWSSEGRCLNIYDTTGTNTRSWVAKSGYLYTWDASGGTLIGVKATKAQIAASIFQPMPKITIRLSVRNGTGPFWGWNVATPVGEWCLAAKVRIPFSVVATIQVPRVCALAIWRFSGINTYQVHWFDLSCLQDGKHYVYDYQTLKLTC